MRRAKPASNACPCGAPHPKPTLDERDELHTRLYNALQAVDDAWSYANQTPAFHDLTDPISQVMRDLGGLKRGV